MSFMIFVTILVLAMALAYPVKESVDTARNSDNMNCTNTALSSFDKAACLATDTMTFLFIGFLIFLGGVYFFARYAFS